MQLSSNFTLEELLHSTEADAKGFTEQYSPAQDVVGNLNTLAQQVLQPLRDKLGKPLNISSGYRCTGVNTAIGGVHNSQHLFGQAADTEVPDMTIEDWFKWVLASGIEFDQLIQEFDHWVHISYNAGHNRHQVFRAVMNEQGHAVYIPLHVSNG
jgi:hypothetical protein